MTLTAGLMVSNALTVDALSRESICLDISGGAKYAGEVTICWSLAEGFLKLANTTGIWSVYAGVGIGKGLSVAIAPSMTGYVKLMDRWTQWVPFAGDVEPLCWLVMPCPRGRVGT